MEEERKSSAPPVQEPTSRPEPEPRSRPAWKELFRTTEGRILFIGIAATLVGLIVMSVIAFWSPRTSHMIGAMTFFNMVFGRALSMSIGYAGGYGHTLVVAVNIWVETMMVLLFYPLFVFSMRKLVVFPRLKRFLDRTQKAAERHHDKVRQYGIAGLMIFVWFPFWMTGPVVGSAIGYLLGFRAWLTVTVVLIGTYIAIGGWAYLMSALHSKVATFGPWAPMLVIVLMILIIVMGYWLSRHEKEQHQSNKTD